MAAYNNKKIGWATAAAIVVANMIGTGVFTTLGFQLVEIQNTWSILLLWSLGGVIALLGAFSYAELGTHMRRSGGEYHFISKTIHPFLGYLSGWVSLTVGFAAPVALASMGMAAYLGKFVNIPAVPLAIMAVLLISLVHSFDIKKSSGFQDIFTVVKILVIAAFVGIALFTGTNANAVDTSRIWMKEVSTPAFAVALVYVTYAFTGWNSAAYIVEEIKYPRLNLPKALIGGTLLVTVLYILLQLAFLKQAPLQALQGKLEVGQIVAEHMFGWIGGKWMSIAIALMLVSSISAMVWVGPRITRAMADDYPLWHFVGRDNQFGIPVRAIWLQAGISIFLILSGSFQQILLFSGFVLQLFSMLAVIGVFVLRRRKKEAVGFKSPFYPWIQIAYLAISAWIVIYMIVDQPKESLWGLVLLAIGAGTFLFDKLLLHKGKKMRSGGWSQETDTSKSVPFSKNKLKAAKDLIQQL
jgi:APA family basic amino acid/polyamine antiporter